MPQTFPGYGLIRCKAFQNISYFLSKASILKATVWWQIKTIKIKVLYVNLWFKSYRIYRVKTRIIKWWMNKWCWKYFLGPHSRPYDHTAFPILTVLLFLIKIIFVKLKLHTHLHGADILPCIYSIWNRASRPRPSWPAFKGLLSTDHREV